MMTVIVRFGRQQWEDLCALLFSRYPNYEWATWVRFGWRRSGDEFVFTQAEIDPPRRDELDASVGHVAFQEPYSLRVALEAEHHPFAVGVVHSHPKECLPIASAIDDDMDRYYSDFLHGFTSGRPYLSLIISEVGGERVVSGRIWSGNAWHPVTRFVAEGFCIPTWNGDRPPLNRPANRRRVARLQSQFGERATQRICNATVAVVGASGTGSPAIEVLARAGVGHLVVVEPDTLDESNLERVHGAYPHHASSRTSKALVAREHVAAIDPDIRFDAYVGRVPQPEVVDALATCDVIIGCTDQQHSRLALSEIAFRYLIPVIDCGVSLEGAGGEITGQTIQLVRFDTEGPCAICRGMIDWQQVSQELMSESDRDMFRRNALEAEERGDDPNGYWRNFAQLNTVGYLTTAAGALAAGCALGIVSGTFRPGFSRAQLNLLCGPIDAVDWQQAASSICHCQIRRGHADLSAADRFITPPSHWPEVSSVMSRQ